MPLRYVGRARNSSNQGKAGRIPKRERERRYLVRREGEMDFGWIGRERDVCYCGRRNKQKAYVAGD